MVAELRVLSLVKNKNVPVTDEVADIKAQIERLKDEGQRASAEADRLELEKQSGSAATTFSEWKELDQRIGFLRSQANGALTKIEELREPLAIANWDITTSLLVHHRDMAKRAYLELRRAVEAAAKAQTHAMKTHEAAVAVLGQNLVNQHVPHSAYKGLILEDLVALWARDGERTWAVKWSPPPRPVRPEPKPPLTPEQRAALRTQRHGLGHAVNRIGGAPPPAAAKAPVPAPAPVKPPRALHKARKPGPDQMVVRFVRPGTPLGETGTDYSRIGDEIVVERELGTALCRNGACTEIQK